MTLTATKEGVKFSVAGDIGAGNVFIKPRDSDKPEEKVSVTVHENVTSNFALRYLVNFAKAAPLSGSVELGLGPDAPLLVKYELEKAENGNKPQRLGNAEVELVYDSNGLRGVALVALLELN